MSGQDPRPPGPRMADPFAADPFKAEPRKADPLALWRRNPFFVLELPTEASPGEVERAGQRLLALLAVGSEAAGQCRTPLGPAPRDADMVREALATLRDPVQRVLHELWADVAPGALDGPRHARVESWEEAGRALGWNRPWAR
jgi:hypothetical protein